jgi:microcystin degradation protein MlrC
MKKRVFVGGLHHESDTFNPIITGRDEIWVTRGADLFIKRESSASGVINTLIAAGYEVVPSLVARAVPNGVWDHDYYQELKREMLQKLTEAGSDRRNLPVAARKHACRWDRERPSRICSKQLENYTQLLLYSPVLDMHATLTKRMRHAADGFCRLQVRPPHRHL